MTIISKTFPKIHSEEINTKLGIYKKNAQITKSFLTTTKNGIFTANKTPLLLSKSSNTKAKMNGFLLEIIFHGFNYSAKRFKLFRPKYFLDTHKSEVFICDENAAGTFKSRVHKRRLIFFSYDSDLLCNIERAIKEFRVPDSYTGKGLFSREDSYQVKKLRKRK